MPNWAVNIHRQDRQESRYPRVSPKALRENNGGKTFQQHPLPEDIKGKSELGSLHPEEHRALRDAGGAQPGCCWSRAPGRRAELPHSLGNAAPRPCCSASRRAFAVSPSCRFLLPLPDPTPPGSGCGTWAIAVVPSWLCQAAGQPAPLSPSCLYFILILLFPGGDLIVHRGF